MPSWLMAWPCRPSAPEAAQGRSAVRPGKSTWPVPLIEMPEPEHIKASKLATRALNAPYLTVMLEGSYTDAHLKQAGADAPTFSPDDLKIIAEPVDFVGINVYRPTMYVVATARRTTR